MGDLRFRKKGKKTNVVMIVAEPNTESIDVIRVDITIARSCSGDTMVPPMLRVEVRPTVGEMSLWVYGACLMH
jgi:hypothetical protein